MDPLMRAKMQITEVTSNPTTSYPETVRMSAVSGDKPFGPAGESEDNTFACYTPFGELRLEISNPALRGKFSAGQKFYLDFTLADS